MSYNGSGTFAINSTGQPVVAGTVISSTDFNSLTADLGTGLSTAITKDGQTTTTALILFAAGVSSTLSTDATSISTGSLLTSGGLGVTKAAWIGGLMNVAGAATFQSSVSISGVVTFTGLTFTLDLKSNTAFATPSALSATGYRAFASTVSGAAMMGFGTTNDVSLMNRAGTVVLGVGPNTTLVNIPAALTVGTTLGITGTTTAAAINASGTVAMAGAATVGTTFAVTGATTLSSTLDVTGATTVAGTIFSTGGFAGQGAFVERNSSGGATLGSSLSSGSVILATNSTTRLTVDSAGAVTIPGSLSKGSGSFRISHPLPDLNKTHNLVHSFIEGPQADLIYRGKVSLIGGKATVNIDAVATMTNGTFVILCRDVQCFTTNETDWNHVRGSVVGNILTIECQDTASVATISWMVIGERQDKHMMETEWTDENGKVIVESVKLETK